MASDLKRRPMRIAAGGLLVLACLFNVFVALGYLVGGGFAVRLGGMLGGGAESFDTVNSALLESVGGGTTLGYTLVVSAVIILAGAVSILRSRSPITIYGGCVMAMLAAILEVSLTQVGVTSFVGIIGGGLGFISGLRIQMTAAQPAGAGDAGQGEAPSKPRDLWDWLAVGAIVVGLLFLMAAAFLWFV